ncbi:MAG TPA: hypothetical protein VHK91_00100 [Flavisolibacter sp.]|jgi:hypothetical protein|nr:hypothetical protein [Flavisolibacter sp.]
MRTLSSILLCLFFTVSHAQRYIFKEGPPIKIGYGATRLFAIKDQYYSFFGKVSLINEIKNDHENFANLLNEDQMVMSFTNSQVEQYDQNFKVTSSKPLLPSKISATVVQAGDNLLVLSSEESEGPLRVQSFDPVSGTLGTSQLVMSDYQRGRLFAQESPDHSLVLLVERVPADLRQRQDYNIAVLNAAAQKLGSFKVTTGVDNEDVIDQNFFISKTQQVYIITQIQEKKKEMPRYVIQAYSSSGSKLKEYTMELPTGFVSAGSFSFDGTLIHFGGLKAKDRKDDYTSFIAASVDPQTWKLSLREYELSTAPEIKASMQAGGEKIFSGSFSRNFSPVRVIQNQEGDLYYIFEEANYVRNIDIKNYMSQIRSVLAFRVTKDNGLAWVRYLPKRQEEAVMKYFTGANAMIDEKGELHVFFLDREKNLDIQPGDKPAQVNYYEIGKSLLADVHIDRKGNVKKSLMVEAGRDFIFTPFHFKMVKPGSLVTMAVYQSPFAKQQFKFGLLTVK